MKEELEQAIDRAADSIVSDLGKRVQASVRMGVFHGDREACDRLKVWLFDGHIKIFFMVAHDHKGRPETFIEEAALVDTRWVT